MPLIDLAATVGEPRSVAEACDICIIGSGPAGSTIARELAKSGIETVILESGGAERSPFADALNEIENVGRPRIIDQWGLRNRIIGGSSHTWGGRCAPFDDIDFEERDWVPHSGWPIRSIDLVPFLDRSAPYLGLTAGSHYTGTGFWELRNRPRPARDLPSHKLEPFFWQFSQDGQSDYRFEYMRLGPRLLNSLPSTITLIANATVLELVPDVNARAIRSVTYAGPDGTRRTIATRLVILCGGGIENARLLLASNSAVPNGLGNQRDLVGRYLMDHPRGPVGSFEIRGSGALQRRFGRYNVRGHLFRAGFRLSPAVQRTERLINCAGWLGETAAEDDPLEAIKRLVSRRASYSSDLSTVLRSLPLLARGAYDYFIKTNGLPRKLAALTLDVMSEQIPDPDSRVMLSDRRDRLGMPLSRIDWRVHSEESRAFRRIARLAAEQLPRIGLPALKLEQWVLDDAEMPLSFTDVGHPIGTTRMSDDPTRGVVDRNCQVHGISGLFVSGTSTFPTAGHANPTQMIVAMALRLADHIKSRPHRPISAGTVATPKQLGKTILVTGATGRIGKILVSDLIARGYRVRATTSDRQRAASSHPQIEFMFADFSVGANYDELVSGCDAIAHLAADLGNMEQMLQVNAGATRELAVAAEKAKIASFCYVSTVSIYGSGRTRIITEQSPTLTSDRDVRSEYWALDYVRMYGRTKLMGEKAIADVAKLCRYTVFRPTVVVDIPDIIGIRDWSSTKRILAAHRRSHHIYVRDVSDAVIWALERGLSGAKAAGSVETFNLSEDDFPEPYHRTFMLKAYNASNDPRYRVPIVPGFADWLHDFLRFRAPSLRNPLWRMRFPNDQLKAAGYTLKYGMNYAYQRALETLQAERSSSQGVELMPAAHEPDAEAHPLSP